MKKGLLALSPLIFFVVTYFFASFLIGDFYKIPISVAFLLSAVYSILITKGPIDQRVKIFSEGAGSSYIMFIIWIFILAGAFASVARSMGAVDSVVNFTLHSLPASFLLPGLFLASCFVSFSIGTSVGTIVAIMPVAVGVASQLGVSLPLMVGLVVGGAFFGDNLSFISDTTVVATQTQGCQMKDKFRANVLIVIPVAFMVFCFYLFFGLDLSCPASVGEYSVLKILPYIFVIIAAIAGLNVLIVLLSGLLFSGCVGLCDGSFDIYSLMSAASDGILGMGELIVVSMLAGGMLAIVKHNGGVDFILNTLSTRISGRAAAERYISLLVALVNLTTANNTIALITAGPIANEVSRKFSISPSRSASIIDISSCIVQSLIPYGAQMLFAAKIVSDSIGSQFNCVCVMPFMFYPLGLALALQICIIFGWPKKFSVRE